MNARAFTPAAGTSFPVAFIADQDEASRDFVFRALSSGSTPKQWKSMFWYGRLVYLGRQGDRSYRLERDGETAVKTDRGDKSKRGAEYSALEVFDGRVLTFCDRTGNCDELVLEQEAFTNKTLVTARPLIDAEGKQVSIPMVSPVEGAALPTKWLHRPLTAHWQRRQVSPCVRPCRATAPKTSP